MKSDCLIGFFIPGYWAITDTIITIGIIRCRIYVGTNKGNNDTDKDAK